MSTIFIMFMLGWIAYLATRLLMSAPHVGTPAPTRARQAGAAQRSETASDIGTQQAVAWSELDERQLTRLLDDAAAGTNDE